MDTKTDVMESISYRRDRGGLVLFTLIIIVYTFAGGYISEDAGTLGNGLSLIVGVRFKNTDFIEALVVVGMFYFLLKFIISSSAVRRFIHTDIHDKLEKKIHLGKDEHLTRGVFTWYGSLIEIGGYEEGVYEDKYKIIIFPCSKYYLISKRMEIKCAMERPEYLDYYVPWLFTIVAIASILWKISP